MISPNPVLFESSLAISNCSDAKSLPLNAIYLYSRSVNEFYPCETKFTQKTKKAGFTWLHKKLNIKGFRLTHESYIGTTDKTELSLTNTVVRTFKSKYDVSNDNPMSHLEFALKYDDLNLAFLKEVFSSVTHQTILNYIKANPNGK